MTAAKLADLIKEGISNVNLDKVSVVWKGDKGEVTNIEGAILADNNGKTVLILAPLSLAQVGGW